MSFTANHRLPEISAISPDHRLAATQTIRSQPL
jgi:hypothetical protein